MIRCFTSSATCHPLPLPPLPLPPSCPLRPQTQCSPSPLCWESSHCSHSQQRSAQYDCHFPCCPLPRPLDRPGIHSSRAPAPHRNCPHRWLNSILDLGKRRAVGIRHSVQHSTLLNRSALIETHIFSIVRSVSFSFLIIHLKPCKECMLFMTEQTANREAHIRVQLHTHHI